MNFDLLVLGVPGRDPSLLLFGVTVTPTELRAEMWLCKNPVRRGKRLEAVQFARPGFPRHALGFSVRAPHAFRALRGGEWGGLQQSPLRLLLEARDEQNPPGTETPPAA